MNLLEAVGDSLIWLITWTFKVGFSLLVVFGLVIILITVMG